MCKRKSSELINHKSLRQTIFGSWTRCYGWRDGAVRSAGAAANGHVLCDNIDKLCKHSHTINKRRTDGAPPPHQKYIKGNRHKRRQKWFAHVLGRVFAFCRKPKSQKTESQLTKPKDKAKRSRGKTKSRGTWQHNSDSRFREGALALPKNKREIRNVAKRQKTMAQIQWHNRFITNIYLRYIINIRWSMIKNLQKKKYSHSFV